MDELELSICCDAPRIGETDLCAECKEPTDFYFDHDHADYDPSPYCSHCGAMTKAKCDCGPIPDND